MTAVVLAMLVMSIVGCALDRAIITCKCLCDDGCVAIVTSPHPRMQSRGVPQQELRQRGTRRTRGESMRPLLVALT